MLVLTRKPSQGIIIGNNIINIKVLSVNGKQVRLGITAPKDITVNREEVQRRIEANEIDKKDIIEYKEDLE